MDTSFCFMVQEWIVTLDDPATPAPPPPNLCSHVAGCASCRAALLLLTVELLQAPLDVAPIPCAQCQADLAAFIDVERAEGVAAALRTYPHVWWHLWICAECAEIYQLTTAIQAAESDGELAAMPLASLVDQPPPARMGPVIRTLTLPRLWLARMLVPQLSPTWGAGDDDTVILDEEESGYQFNVLVRKARDAQWNVIVTVEPPIAGEVVLTLGAAVFRAPFGPDGVAAIGPIPNDLLADPAGPDMAITIDSAP